MKTVLTVGALFALAGLILFLASISMLTGMIVGGIAFVGYIVWYIQH